MLMKPTPPLLNNLPPNISPLHILRNLSLHPLHKRQHIQISSRLRLRLRPNTKPSRYYEKQRSQFPKLIVWMPLRGGAEAVPSVFAEPAAVVVLKLDERVL